jgi:hypothetical protein
VQWGDLAAACALYLVLEGLMPFLNPAAFRELLGRVSQLSDGALRGAGLASMLAGLALLYLVR